MYREDLAENCKQLVLITFFSRIAFNQIFADRWNCTFQLNLMMDWEAKETEKKCHWNSDTQRKNIYRQLFFDFINEFRTKYLDDEKPLWTKL